MRGVRFKFFCSQNGAPTGIILGISKTIVSGAYSASHCFSDELPYSDADIVVYKHQMMPRLRRNGSTTFVPPVQDCLHEGPTSFLVGLVRYDESRGQIVILCRVWQTISHVSSDFGRRGEPGGGISTTKNVSDGHNQ
jgi:hypothetical protein